ncbi:MAG: dienelactone hydrolase family protein [Acidobacteria bacterium]|nr:dienelactone hydrolase family protein [Acidobacteriota bacterium]
MKNPPPSGGRAAALLLCLSSVLALAACAGAWKDGAGGAHGPAASPANATPTPQAGAGPGGEFLQRTVEVAGRRYGYQLYNPAGTQPGEKRPVLLFLHGTGEGFLPAPRKEGEVGLAPEVMREQIRAPFVAVFPHCPDCHQWTNAGGEALALAALDAAVAEFGGDPERLYLTGVSMGGIGAWHLASRHPNKFAAVVVVSGRSPSEGRSKDPYGEVARAIGRTPVWVFHGAEDAVVPTRKGRLMRDALERAGAVYTYTEYPGVGHNAWERAYAEREMWDWLARQRLGRKD